MSQSTTRIPQTCHPALTAHGRTSSPRALAAPAIQRPDASKGAR
ncbi:hypothetical protein [Streptomyces sp. NPDC008121]